MDRVPVEPGAAGTGAHALGGVRPVAAGLSVRAKGDLVPQINSAYHVGVDGISVPMVLLTALVTPLALLISFGIQQNVRAYLILFLMLEAGMLGVFVSLDLIVFFVFWRLASSRCISDQPVGRQGSQLRIVQVLYLHHGGQPGHVVDDPVYLGGDGHV